VKKPGPVAVIGGGVAGVSCAHALQAAGADVRLLERAPALGGRCATRLWQGHLIDLGVQYFTAQSADFKKELLTRLRQFRPIITPILDQDDKLVVSESGPRFYVLQGNHYLAHVLAHGVDVRLSSEVEALTFRNGKIECMGATYRAVVCAVPGPQAARLLGMAEAPVEYEPCITAMLEYGHDDKEPARQCYARIQPDDSPVIAASFCENHKAGRIIGSRTVFVVNTSSSFSVKYADEAPEDYLPLITGENERMWHLPSGLCRARSIHVWRYGRPLASTRRELILPPGAFVCGDSRSTSTVEDVWLDGRRVASEVMKYICS
jgi:predicted NAD/FAD-dependent oxidoreductase